MVSSCERGSAQGFFLFLPAFFLPLAYLGTLGAVSIVKDAIQIKLKKAAKGTLTLSDSKTQKRPGIRPSWGQASAPVFGDRASRGRTLRHG